MAELENGKIACYGCGALVPDIDGPTHRYLGASPGCWGIHGEVLARRYADTRLQNTGLMITNSYAVQHPGSPSPQSIQSVAAHLIGLYAALEQHVGSRAMVEVLKGAADGSALFRWLDPPTYSYSVTIVDLFEATNSADFIHLTDEMGQATWNAWQIHQNQIREWASELRLLPNTQSKNSI